MTLVATSPEAETIVVGGVKLHRSPRPVDPGLEWERITWLPEDSKGLVVIWYAAHAPSSDFPRGLQTAHWVGTAPILGLDVPGTGIQPTFETMREVLERQIVAHFEIRTKLTRYALSTIQLKRHR